MNLHCDFDLLRSFAYIDEPSTREKNCEKSNIIANLCAIIKELSSYQETFLKDMNLA